MNIPAERWNSPSEFLDTLLERPGLIDTLIAAIDERIGRQVDAIIHHPEFQALESSWRGLKFVTDRLAWAEGTVKVYLWQCAKRELVADLEDSSSDRTKSAFFRVVYSADYGQLGGIPYATIFANFTVTSSLEDIGLLRGASAVAAMSHAMFFVNGGPPLFGHQRFDELAGADLDAIFDAPRLARWNDLREVADVRYVGVVLPRFLLRTAYSDVDEPTESFVYNETVTGLDEQLWGAATYALSIQIGNSHARSGTAMGMTGNFCEPPIRTWHPGMTRDALKPPVEVLFSRQLERSLSAHGFLVLTVDSIECTFGFLSANSIQNPPRFGGKDGQQETFNHMIAAKIPYLLFASRFAHLIKIVQRESLSGHQTPKTIERLLNESLRPYVNDISAPSPETLQKYPLRGARVSVQDVEGNAGWFSMTLRLLPHMRYLGGAFRLDLPGRLDRR